MINTNDTKSPDSLPVPVYGLPTPNITPNPEPTEGRVEVDGAKASTQLDTIHFETAFIRSKEAPQIPSIFLQALKAALCTL